MADKLNAKTHVLQGKDELITSYYGKRTDPVTGKVNITHVGIDLISDGGNRTIIAFAAGTVTSTRNTYTGRTTDGSAGNYITITHADGIKTMYKHLKKNSLLVKKGDKVEAGQAIATMGDTGHTTGVHLHFDVVINDNRVDPLPYLRGEKNLLQKSLFGNRGNNPKIKWGTKANSDIKDLQVWLNNNRKARILSDGIAGSRTLAFAKKYTVKKNADGFMAYFVQKRLKDMGFYSGLVDGEPRGLTENAIRAFETAYGLTVNGKVSGNDWYYLLAIE